MKPLLRLLFVIIGLTLYPLQARAAETGSRFIYPSGQTAVTVADVRLIGATGPAVTKVILHHRTGQTVNEITVAAADGSFNQLFALKPGENIVELLADGATPVDVLKIYLLTKPEAEPPPDYDRYYLHSKGELAGNCGECHLLQLREKSNYQYITPKSSCRTKECHQEKQVKKFSHGPFVEDNCLSCHNPHGAKYKDFLKGLRAGLCNDCHETSAEIAGAKVVHFPVAKGECLACHEPHTSDLEYHLKRQTMAGLCAGCHGDAMTRHEYMHDPVQSQDCNACHVPHVSEYKGLLPESGSALCFRCHTERKEEFQSKHVHEPVAKDCGLCHDPHGSAAEFHLRTRIDEKGRYLKPEKPMTESCLRCHLKLDPEVAKEITSAKVTHKPVVEDRCTVCHTPHSTNHEKQLKTALSETCYPCHQKLKQHITSSLYKHGPVRTDNCAQCHRVHGSNFRALLTANFSEEFDAEYDPENYRLCFNCHNENVVAAKSNPDTGFRNGHDNLHYVHVNRKEKARNCSTCHEIHASDQERHIRRKVPFGKKHTISLDFTKTVTGGGCVVGCHKPRDYDRENPVKYKKD